MIASAKNAVSEQQCLIPQNGTGKAKPFPVVSLFSGCGGMDRGFRGDFTALGKYYEPLPFEVAWANDNNAVACKTYRRNLSDVILHDDIWKAIDKLPPRTDVVIGGFPCQDISINGKQLGVSGERSGLYKAMLEVIGRCKPKLFVAENVKALLQKNQKASLAQIIGDFSALGYTNLSYNLYCAADYGIPQMRERVFIVGASSRVKPFHHPWPIVQRASWVTSKQAIGDLESLDESSAINHVWSRAERSPDQGSRVLRAGEPGDTIRAECHGNVQFHYSLPRRLSMRECARIQSFPDDFLFDGGLRETERQIGNAVPPVLAWYIARSVRDCLSHD